MTNKEKARSLIDQIHLKQEAMRNALHWDYSQKEINRISTQINKLQDELVAMIPD